MEAEIPKTIVSKHLDLVVDDFEKLVLKFLDSGLEHVMRCCSERELMRAVTAVESVLEGLQQRKDVLEQIFCLTDEVDRFVRISKLIEVSKEHVVDKNGCDQLDRLKKLLEAIRGILSTPPCGIVYNFPCRGKINLPDRHRGSSDSHLEGMVSPSASTASFVSVPRGDSTSTSTASHGWMPRGKSVAWAWGDLWRPATSNPLRYSRWFDLGQAVEDLQKLQCQGVTRPVYILIWETDLFDNIEKALLWIATHRQSIGQPPLQITWTWADRWVGSKLNPVRWSSSMSVESIVPHLEIFHQAAPSRPVKLSVSNEKLCSNVLGAIAYLQSSQLSLCQSL